MARFIYPVGGSGDVSFTGNGCIEFPNNGEICNPANSSSDGLGLSTLQLYPDNSYEDDRYIVIDPTVPNHVHIRAGGQIDKSQAVLLLGGEKNAVAVVDSFGGVGVQATQPESHDYLTNESLVASSYLQTSFSEPTQVGASVVVNDTTYFVTNITQIEEQVWHIEVGAEEPIFQPNDTYEFIYDNYPSQYWFFSNNGVLNGPDNNNLVVNGLVGANSQDLSIYSSAGSAVVLDGDSGEFLNSSEYPLNQIATIGDVAASATPYHASFYSTNDQSAALNTATAMTYNEEDFANGITIEDNSKITIANAGKYNIQFSAQLFHAGGAGEGETVNIWIAKNGNPITNSNTKVIVQSNYRYVVAAWNFFVDAAAEDYYEIMWATDNTSIDIVHEPSGAYPAIPSVILTVNQIA